MVFRPYWNQCAATLDGLQCLQALAQHHDLLPVGSDFLFNLALAILALCDFGAQFADGNSEMVFDGCQSDTLILTAMPAHPVLG